MASKKKPDDLSIGYFITLISKYYLSDEIDVESNTHHEFVEDYDEFKPGQTALSAEELEDMHPA